jgi:hypothetical protein
MDKTINTATGMSHPQVILSPAASRRRDQLADLVQTAKGFRLTD